MFMLQFGPGLNTPLQFYLTNQLHGSDAVFGYFTGIFLTAIIPAFLLYGYLACKKVPLGKLLFYGTIITGCRSSFRSPSSIRQIARSCSRCRWA